MTEEKKENVLEKVVNKAFDKDGKPKYAYWNERGEEIDRFGNKVTKETD